MKIIDKLVADGVVKKMDDKVESLGVFKSYVLTRIQSKRYLKYKYILKHTKKARIRIKVEKMLGSFYFNDMYIGEDL